MTDKPKNIAEYKKWLKDKHKVEITDRTCTHYNSATSTIKADIEKSDLWELLTQNLQEYNDEYLLRSKGYQLLMPDTTPVLHIKPYDSFLLKTFRKNVLANRCWPHEPDEGWILPENWFFRISDVIRTTLVVKYLDGVEFMIEKLVLLFKEMELDSEVVLEAREEGYYAAHLYTKKECEIPRINWDTEKIDISIEIQITTQIQEVIRRLLHKYYEERRVRITKEKIKWQWNYKDDEFVANYLGHILHYVEGMIMEVREKQREEEEKEKYERRVHTVY